MDHNYRIALEQELQDAGQDVVDQAGADVSAIVNGTFSQEELEILGFESHAAALAATLEILGRDEIGEIDFEEAFDLLAQLPDAGTYSLLGYIQSLEEELDQLEGQLDKLGKLLLPFAANVIGFWTANNAVTTVAELPKAQHATAMGAGATTLVDGDATSESFLLVFGTEPNVQLPEGVPSGLPVVYLNVAVPEK